MPANAGNIDRGAVMAGGGAKLFDHRAIVRQRLEAVVTALLNDDPVVSVIVPCQPVVQYLIAALQARFAEPDELVDGSELAGSTLLTSFQHEAVENAAAATRVLGLPAVKVGRGTDGDENLWIERWKTEGYDPDNPPDFGTDRWETRNWFFPNPPFEHKVIDENEATILYINHEGICQEYPC